MMKSMITTWLFTTLYLGVSTAVIADEMMQPVSDIRSSDEVVDHVIWNNIPIRVVLPVGRERRIDFPVAVKIEWPDDVAHNTRNLQLRENGSIYWTADTEFERQRVNVYTFSGESYLLDVEARFDAPARTLVILDDRFDQHNNADQHELTRKTPAAANLDSVDLARFASQMLYGPRRLVKKLPGVTRVPVSTADVPLYKGGELRTSPVAQWKTAGMHSLYITAIRVTSDSLVPVTLDPRNLRGNWLNATPEHGRVNPAGDDGDTTAWYLISSRPFEEVAP